MKKYHYKEYGGNGEYAQGYQRKGYKKTQRYKKNTTYPWRNRQRLIHPT